MGQSQLAEIEKSNRVVQRLPLPGAIKEGPFLFTRAILEDRPIDVHNRGEMKRDFTYIDDAVEGIVRVLAHVPRCLRKVQAAGNCQGRPWRRTRYTISGNNEPVSLLHFVKVLEGGLGKCARLNLMPMQAKDVPVTFADISELVSDIGYAPKTPIDVGLPKFVEWYKSHYGTPAKSVGA